MTQKNRPTDTVDPSDAPTKVTPLPGPRNPSIEYASHGAPLVLISLTDRYGRDWTANKVHLDKHGFSVALAESPPHGSLHAFQSIRTIVGRGLNLADALRDAYTIAERI